MTSEYSKLTKDEINILRDIPIHKILGVDNRGRNISIRCPFHHERTPSFTLFPDNHFHCFGCGVHGKGAIDFCVGMGYTFIEALEELVKYL